MTTTPTCGPGVRALGRKRKTSLLADWIKVVLQVFPSVGMLAALIAILAAFLRYARRAGHFFDDWFGEPARPGVPKRSGVMERLHDVESELKTNGGTSLRDVCNRVETKQDSQAETLRQFNTRLTVIEDNTTGDDS